jgi:hypothetical protein
MGEIKNTFPKHLYRKIVSKRNLFFYFNNQNTNRYPNAAADSQKRIVTHVKEEQRNIENLMNESNANNIPIA